MEINGPEVNEITAANAAEQLVEGERGDDQSFSGDIKRSISEPQVRKEGEKENEVAAEKDSNEGNIVNCIATETNYHYEDRRQGYSYR